MTANVVQSSSYRRFLQRMDGLRAAGVLLGLDRVKLALARLCQPQSRLRFVQVAGTNGKGSTAAMTEAILREAGVRTGLYTSPHLLRFTERIRIQGREVDPAALEPVLDRVLATGVALTYFEAATLVAVCLMADAGVELAVMETGLGGRLDAVTALPAVATAITSIGPDHMDLLGPTLLDVAREKAAIARPQVPLFVSGGVSPALRAAIVEVVTAAGAPAQVVEPHVQSPLRGAHQRHNAGVAMALAKAAAEALGRPLSDAEGVRGLTQTVWPGRLEQVGRVLFDCAHNGEGAEALAQHLAARPERPRLLVLSVVSGKDVHAIAAALSPQADAIIATRCASERALAGSALAALLPPSPTLSVIEDPHEALAQAQARAGEGLVVVAGSVFLVGQLRGAMLGEPVDPVTTSDPLAVRPPAPGASP